jgi:TrmH family RNA methyltransferase
LKLLTLARDLRRRKAREKQGLFAAEGVRAVEELVRSPLTVRGVLIAPQLADAPRGAALIGILRTAGVEIVEIPPLDFASAAETESPQGVLAIAEIPERTLGTLSVGTRARIVVLDAVQDPGNVGTILRTSAALGATAAVSLPGTVDLWNAKVVRSAMGASFHFPVLSTTWEELDLFRQEHGVALWGADAAGIALDRLVPPARLALVVGNEGAGLSPEARSRIDTLAALPIGSVVESLNVAVATGIFLYQLRS